MMLALGIVLIIIALILGAVQLTAHAFSIYGSRTTKYGYYAVVLVIGLIGIMIAAYSYVKKPTVAQTKLKVEGPKTFLRMCAKDGVVHCV